MSSGVEAFWHYRVKSLPLKMKAFGSTSQRLSVCIYRRQKRKWKMRKEAQLDLVLCHCDRLLFIFVYSGRIECIVYRIIRHPHGLAMNTNCDSVVQAKWKCNNLTDYQ